MRIDRNEDGLAALRTAGAERLARAVDVTDKAALEACVGDFCAGNVGGGLDMIGNNAGIAMFDVPYESPCVVDVNFKVVLIGACTAFTPRKHREVRYPDASSRNGSDGRRSRSTATKSRRRRR